MKYMLSVLLALLVMTTGVAAQSISTDLSLDVIPENPAPGTTVTLTARSYGVDLNQTTLVWTYNGAQIAQGTGKTTIRVVAPAAGATGVVTVSASGVGLEATTTTALLRPGSVDLLWEAADAYTPPFYKGKALLPVGGLIRVTAVPAGGNGKSLVYTWQRSNSALENLSGFGKSSILIRHSALNAQEKIDVSTSGGQGTLRLASYAPLAIAYENNDGFIDYAHGSDSTITINGAGTVLHFEPYYFSTPTQSTTDVAISTTVDGQSVVGSKQNELALSRPEQGGKSVLNLAITTVTYSLQHLEKTFTLLFN